MNSALFLVFVLNVADAIFTSFVVSSALAVEANPLMGAVLQYGIAPFVIVKLNVIFVSILVLWRYRHKKITQIGTGICLLTYIFLILYFAYHLSDV